MKRRSKTILFLGFFLAASLTLLAPSITAAEGGWELELNVKDNDFDSFTPDYLIVGMSEEPENHMAPPYPPSPFFFWTVENGSESFKEFKVPLSEEYIWDTKILASSSGDDPENIRPVITWSLENYSQSKSALMVVDDDIVDLQKEENYVWKDVQWNRGRAYLEPEILVGQEISGYPLEIEDLKIEPKLANSGEDVTVKAEIRNNSSEPLEREVRLFVDESLESSKQVYFSEESLETVDFQLTRAQEKNYEVTFEVGDEEASDKFLVREEVEVGDFELSDLEVSPKSVGPGENVEITCKVKNSGGAWKEQVLELHVEDEVEDYEVVQLNGGQSNDFKFITSREVPGEYGVNIVTGDESVTGSFEVVEDTPVENVRIENLTISPKEVEPGKPVTVSGFIKNYGKTGQDVEVVFYVDGEEDTQLPPVNISPGENQSFEFKYSTPEQGDYDFLIGVLDEEEGGSFSVNREFDFPTWILVPFFIVLIVGLTVALAARKGAEKI